MTATTTTRPRPTLEALVDQLIDAIFGLGEPVLPVMSPARAIHEARRLSQVGDLDGALSVLTAFDLNSATEGEQRWAYAEFLELALARFRDEEALIYSPATGRAAALTPAGDGLLRVRAVLGMRWRAGKLVSRRSLRGLKLYCGGRRR